MRPNHIQFQKLEPRVLLALAQLSSTGTMIVNGTASAEEIEITAFADQIYATVAGAVFNFPIASVRRVYVDAGGGNDSVFLNVKLRATVLGSDGRSPRWRSRQRLTDRRRG